MRINVINNFPRKAIRLHEDLLRKRATFLLAQVGKPDSAVSVVLMDDPSMAEYNRKYRSKQGPTNVLSFPAADHLPDVQSDIPVELTADELGDILISVDTALREARERRVSLHRRLTELIIHGLLHLAGYDHEESEEQADIMFTQEKKLYS